MFTVAPMGSTKLAVVLLTPMFSSTQSMVTGRVAALLLVLKASSCAGLMARRKRAYTLRRSTTLSSTG